MLIGYARVSTHDQNLDLQQDSLYAAGCEKIFMDELSGAKAARPGLQQAMDSLREGDVLMVWRLDRLGRSLRNLLELVEKLKERKVGFRSILESMDASSSWGNLIFQVFGALAEFERNIIRDRTNAGVGSSQSQRKNRGKAQEVR